MSKRETLTTPTLDELEQHFLDHQIDLIDDDGIPFGTDLYDQRMAQARIIANEQAINARSAAKTPLTDSAAEAFPENGFGNGVHNSRWNVAETGAGSGAIHKGKGSQLPQR